MSLVMTYHSGTVRMGNKNVIVKEGLDDRDLSGRLVDVLDNIDDESAAAYVLDRSFDEVPGHVLRGTTACIEDLHRLGTVCSHFTLTSSFLPVHIGSGFEFATSRSCYEDTVRLMERLLSTLGLEHRYMIRSRYTNMAVIAIVKR